MPVARLIPSAGVSTPEQTVDRAGFWGNQIKRGGLFVIPLGSPRAQEILKRADTEAIHPEPNEQHVTLRRDAATDLLSAAAAQPARIRQSRRDRRVHGRDQAYPGVLHGRRHRAQLPRPGSKRFHHNRTVSWQMSMPRSDSRSSTWTHPGKVEAPYTVCIASASNLTGLVKSSVECRRTGL